MQDREALAAHRREHAARIEMRVGLLSRELAALEDALAALVWVPQDGPREASTPHSSPRSMATILALPMRGVVDA